MSAKFRQYKGRPVEEPFVIKLRWLRRASILPDGFSTVDIVHEEVFRPPPGSDDMQQRVPCVQ